MTSGSHASPELEIPQGTLETRPLSRICRVYTARTLGFIATPMQRQFLSSRSRGIRAANQLEQLQAQENYVRATRKVGYKVFAHGMEELYGDTFGDTDPDTLTRIILSGSVRLLADAERVRLSMFNPHLQALDREPLPLHEPVPDSPAEKHLKHILNYELSARSPDRWEGSGHIGHAAFRALGHTLPVVLAMEQAALQERLAGS